MADEKPAKRLKRTDEEEPSKEEAGFRWMIHDPVKLPYTFRKDASVLFLPSPMESVRGKFLLQDPPSKGFLVQTTTTNRDENGNENGNDNDIILRKSRDELNSVLPHFNWQEPMVVLTPETNFFRQMVHQTKPNERVLEIGCSTGETSKLLLPLCQSWVGLDTSQLMLDKCKAQISDIVEGVGMKQFHLAKANALVDPTKAFQESTMFGKPNVIFLDIGGNRECINVQRMLSWVLESFQNPSPRLIVVKSREFVLLARSTAEIHKHTRYMINGQDWFSERKQKRALPKHPLKAPLVLSPKDQQTPICRYYNYHKKGCSKLERCELDHDHCHACLEPGHIARECPSLGLENKSGDGSSKNSGEDITASKEDVP